MRRVIFRSVAGGLVGVAMFAGSALADDAASTATARDSSAAADARARYQAGVTAYSSHHYADAIILFLDANKVAPSAALSFDVAQSYDKLGDTSNALAWYRDYLRRASGATDRSDVEEHHVEPLERKLAASGVQQVTLLSTPGDAQLVVDGIDVGRAPWTGNLSPGEHHFAARRDGFATLESDFVVTRDTASDVTVSLTAASPSPPPSTVDVATPPVPRAAVAPKPVDALADRDQPTRASHGSALRTAGWITIGAGGASLGTALVFEILRRSAETAAKNDPTQLGYEDKRTTAENRQTAARVFAGTGAALTVTGLVLVLAAGGNSNAPATEIAFDCSNTQVAARLRGKF